MPVAEEKSGGDCGGSVGRRRRRCGGEVIAHLARSYEREDMLFGPLHYLPLLELNVGALDQAAPLAGWELPEAFQTLRCLLEARAGRAGRREYVQVFRLLETFELHEVHAALDHALALGAIGFDAVKHLVCGGWQSAQPIACVRLHPVDLGVRALALESDRPARVVRTLRVSPSPAARPAAVAFASARASPSKRRGACFRAREEHPSRPTPPRRRPANIDAYRTSLRGTVAPLRTYLMQGGKTARSPC